MKRKSNAFSQAIVGLFMVTVLGLLGYFTIVISGVDVVAGRNRVPMRIAFDYVGGLKDRDNVMYRGTKVGVVDRVEVTPSNLVVVAHVDSGVVMRSDYRVSICNLSMLGGYFLKLEEGRGDVMELSEGVFRGESPTDWMQDVSKIASNIREFTARPELQTIVTNVESASIKAAEFMQKATLAADRAQQIADQISEVVGRVNRGEGMVGKLLSSDESVYNDLKATLADARAAVADAKIAVTNLRIVAAKVNRDETIENLHAGVAAFRKAAESFDLTATRATADELLSNLNAVALKLKNGEGTLGKLANDPKMYDEVNAIIRDVRQVIDNYRDTTPISTFSSLATGAL